MGQNKVRVLSIALTTAIMGGCASVDTNEVEELRANLTSANEKNSTLQTTVSELESRLANSSNMLSTKDSQLSDYEKQLMMAKEGHGGGSLLPPGAKSGECYARVFIPPKFETITKKVPHNDGIEKISVSAARYEWGEERILVREASKKLTVVPAQYRWEEERVLVKEASSKLIAMPAVYRKTTEKVLVRPAYTTWKKGRGPIERIDEATGEIMCLVEIPAQYRDVHRHIVEKPASTRSIEIPAEYKVVKRRVLVEPAKTVEVEIPAEYQTVRVKRVAEGPKENRIPVEGDFQEVTETRMISEGSLEWRPILCETNTTPRVVSRLQSALKAAGYNPGPIDGVIGSETMAAVSRYQRDNSLPSGKLTIEMLRKLGVQ